MDARTDDAANRGAGGGGAALGSAARRGRAARAQDEAAGVGDPYFHSATLRSYLTT